MGYPPLMCLKTDFYSTAVYLFWVFKVIFHSCKTFLLEVVHSSGVRAAAVVDTLTQDPGQGGGPVCSFWDSLDSPSNSISSNISLGLGMGEA